MNKKGRKERKIEGKSGERWIKRKREKKEKRYNKNEKKRRYEER